MKKQKILVSILTFVLACTSMFSASCKKEDNNGGGNGAVVTDTPLFTVSDKQTTIKSSGYNIVENGKSDYVIVIPKGADENVVFGANELKTHIRFSTGVEIRVEEDGGLFHENDCVISLGETTVYKDALSQHSSLALTEDLRLTGYVMKRIGKTLFINAKDGNGVFCGVYDMLSETIGLEYYSYDEVAYREMDTMPLLDFDVRFIPSFDIRDMAVTSLTKTYQRRMKMYSELGKGVWATFAHTVETTYLPVEKYMESHPEYYGNTNGKQVCYANEGMRKEMVKQMKVWIEDFSDARYIMIGHEDNVDMCTCDACIEERELYGNYGGQELHFTNLIAEELDPWVQANFPGRELNYVFFAYQTSQDPPIKTTVNEKGEKVPVLDESGRYVPYYDGLQIHERVKLMYCPIDANFNEPITSESNVVNYDQLRGWRDLYVYAGHEGKDNIIVWAYSLAALNSWVPQDNIGAWKQQYEFYKDMGVGFLFDQANAHSAIFSFEAMRVYTQSKLMYDNTLDYNEIAADFINHYYGEGAEGISRLYNFIRAYYEYMEETKGLNGHIFYEHGADPAFWPTEVIDTMISYCDEALAAIEPLRETDPVRFNTLNNRIRRERLCPIFLMFRHHISEVPLDKKEEYYNDMVTISRMFNIFSESEGGTDMETNYETWYEQLFGN